MTGIHGLKHVDCLAASALAHENAVGSHAKGVLDEISNRILASALEVARARLQRNDMRLLEAKLGCILDGNDTLSARNLCG